MSVHVPLAAGHEQGRTLTYDHPGHYCDVVTALSETIRLVADVDTAIPKRPME